MMAMEGIRTKCEHYMWFTNYTEPLASSNACLKEQLSLDVILPFTHNYTDLAHSISL